MGKKFFISDSEKEKIKKMHKLFEADTTISAGIYNGPIELTPADWEDKVLAPFVLNSPIDEFSDTVMDDNVKTEVGVWELDTKWDEDDMLISYEKPKTIKEDLAVWFGKKKKPKGSKQPKGPWVNICRKVDGKHPPCGRSEAKPGSYPKCRAAGVAGKMTDSQKRSACQQKRRAEKKDPKIGKGNKPTMVSYKPKKKKTNENIIDKKIYTILESFKIS
jgi:hypothetical protein